MHDPRINPKSHRRALMKQVAAFLHDFARAVTLMPLLIPLLLIPPASSFAMESRGGASTFSTVGLGTVLKAGPLDISIVQVSTTTCTTLIQGNHSLRTQSGWEWMYVDWMLRNPGDHRFAFPDPNHPGYRLVVGHHLYPGFYGGYPPYSLSIEPRTTITATWTFAIRRGTNRVKLTYLPPGPQSVLWSIAVPRLSSPIGICPVSP
jgi:hypothetical protein